MKNRTAQLALAVTLLFALAGCSTGNKPLEEAQSLASPGFTTSYHQYMWALVGGSASNQLTEATYSYHKSNAFFSVVRIGGEAAKAQGLAAPQAMETLLLIYVENYSGSNEAITASDNDQEYVRSLTFDYTDSALNEKFTYAAKMLMNKTDGEMMIILAGTPGNSDKLLKSEIALIMDDAVMEEMPAN